MDVTTPGVAEPDERAEVDRLRAEVDRLRAELAAQPAAPAAAEAAAGTGPPTHERTGWWRPVVVTVLLVIVGLLAPAAVLATWAHDQISNTDRYVQTVTPLASNAAVQNAVADRVTTEIFNRLDVQGVTQDAVSALESRGLPPNAAAGLNALTTPLASGVRSYVHDAVLKVLRSSTFQEAWVEANRTAHAQMVAVLTGKQGNVVKVSGNTVSVNLAAIIDTVKTRLEDRGFALAAKIPTVNAQFTILESANLTKAQQAFRVLETLARTLPVLALLLLAVAVFLGRSRRRTLVAGALVVAGSMLLLGIGLNWFRVVYLGAVNPDNLPQDAAAAIYDQLVHFIRLALRAVLVLFLAVAVITWVGGPGPAPVAVRRGTNRALDAVRHRSDSAGLRTGGFGVALWQYRTAIRVAVLGLALLVYVMAAHPTGLFTLVVLVVAGAVLLVVELLARAPSAAEGEPGPDHAGQEAQKQPG